MVMMQLAASAVQRSTGFSHKVMLQAQHLELVTQFVRGWGNSEFAPLTPPEHVEFAAEHHDDGWIHVDPLLPTNAATNLPRNLLEAPDGAGAIAGPASSEVGKAFHPYSELLISMHHTGLQAGRYNQGGGTIPGLMRQVEAKKAKAAEVPSANSAPDSGSLYSKESANAKFLEAEAGRQERLIAQLKADPETAAWVEHGALWTNYRALQFFDTLALYFNLDAPEQRGTTEFPKVPRKAGDMEDAVTVTVSPLASEEGTYVVNPYPFAGDRLEVTLPGTLVKANAEAKTTQEAIDAGLTHVETITLVRAPQRPRL
jgi:hypothetical protein